jgi:opacity protein-like surface antigen
METVMKKMSLHFTLAAIVAALLLPAIAEAQIRRVSSSDSRHSFGFGIGYFSLRGEDSRVEDDILFNELPSFAFEVEDFNGALFDAEWLVGLGEYLEAGVGVGFYQRTVPSVYRDFQDIDGTEIEQDLKLRVIPFTASVRFLPVGRGAAVEPYVGVGIGVNRWRYSETGEFIDFRDDTIFPARYIASGTAAGPVILGGLRFPVADVWDIGGEVRWQRAEGDIDDVDLADIGPKIDLGGISASFKVHLRF